MKLFHPNKIHHHMIFFLFNSRFLLRRRTCAGKVGNRFDGERTALRRPIWCSRRLKKAFFNQLRPQICISKLFLIARSQHCSSSPGLSIFACWSDSLAKDSFELIKYFSTDLGSWCPLLKASLLGSTPACKRLETYAFRDGRELGNLFILRQS